ncbi:MULTISPECIES: DNA internalization-related competence protein ComEC/Rec2 [Cupriavidus]|jgi:competence protein ComEC|uniref:DNA internalization-related competence protein ComEC/Rec2 n=1 Tax=Cupriavidus metallidurans TaxID=119219 RepID=A0A482IMS0_9BURK|nr:MULTISPECIES: DNA internalization-related competence protein ComEC/Rec2 [Cupriavidus]KWR82781.1 competence protein ComEC [Cupriavidus sp. SHE]QBP09222.1 DNA internalization-related competence protein ComEC/Rec2 [Cupriavidus metallidurans]QWC89634.1 DNA internalization-related competence protein ComEC/Rec2 [Cupriavidus metallidurans]
MRAVLLAFVVGCWWLQQQAALPGPWDWVVWGCFALVGLFGVWGVRGREARWVVWVRWLVSLSIAAIVGLGWSAWRADMRLGAWLDPSLAGRDQIIDGVVSGLPDAAPHGTRFLFTVESGASGGVATGDRHEGVAPLSTAPLPPRVLLTWRDPPEVLQPGQRHRLTVRLRRPRGLANPHGFDYGYWLLAEGIGATGYVRHGQLLDRDAAMPLSIRITQWRAGLRDRLWAALPSDAQYRAVLVALVIGDQRGIGPAAWDVFRRTGISHLVSISGLHITMISGVAAALAGLLWRHSFGIGRWLRRPLPLIWPAQKVAMVVAVQTALGYGLIAGMQIPALRTVSMLMVAAVALWSGRTPPPTVVLAWAAGIAVAIDPWAVMSPGFWLSFGAVAVIFLGARGDGSGDGEAVEERQADPKSWVSRCVSRWVSWIGGVAAEAARTQWSVTIGLVPLTLLLFGQVSVVSVFANAVAIPVVSLLVTPLALAGAVLPPDWAAPLLWIAHKALEWLVGGLAWLAAPAWAVWEAAHPGPVATGLALAGVYVLLIPRPSDAKGARRVQIAPRWLGVLLMAPMLSAGREPVEEGEMRVTALDVGQGAAVLVETRRHVLLYDTGPSYVSGASAGGQVIVPYLRATGVRHLDMLMVSHEHDDHAGGVEALLQAVPVAQGLTAEGPGNKPLPNLPEARAWQPCLAGVAWRWDGVDFEVLHPTEEDLARRRLSANARSCVLRVATAQRSVLLTGDIGVSEERRLIDSELGERLRADFLLVPHHGSGTSSHAAFLRAVQPELAVFQLGFANRHRHPREDVWQRYARAGAARYRTDETGAVSIVTGGGDYVVTSFRQQQRRYWRDAPPAPR